MDNSNTEVIEEALQRAWVYGNQEEKLPENEAKKVLSKLSFSIQIVSPADKLLNVEQVGANLAEVNIKEFIK